MTLTIALISLCISETIAFFFIVKYLIKANQDMFHAYMARSTEEYVHIKQTENVKPVKEEEPDEVSLDSLDDEEFIKTIQKQ